MHKLVKELLHVALVHSDDIFFISKGHFKVNLCKFRLTVCAKVLVTEAACDLDVTVKAGVHEKLLVKLRGLGKRVELTGMNSAGNEIVSCSFRCGLDETRCLNIDKSVVSEVVTGDLYDLGTSNDVLLKVRTAKVQITVLQSQFRLNVTLFNDCKRRSLSRSEDLESVNVNLDLTCGDVLVDSRFAS